MPPLDVSAWVAPVSEAEPAGPNLEFDADFGALERAAQGKPEQQYGETVIPAEPPDWKDVDAQAQALLDRTRDLRVIGHLSVARLHLGGLTEFAAVLSLLRELLQARWDEVHPQLDPEDDNDPTLRANALLLVCDPGRVLRHLRDMPLASSVRAGPVSWRDIALATGALEPEPGRGKPPTEAEIRAAFSETEPARLELLRAAAAAAVSDAVAIPAVFDERSGAGTGPDFSDLQKVLREIQRDLDRYAVAGPAAAEPEPEVAMPGEAPAPGPQAVRPAGATAASLGAVTSRADALRLLDLVCQYYERHEPSSPLPLLIDRARRLADKNFLDILRDLAPEGLGQAQMITGTRDE